MSLRASLIGAEGRRILEFVEDDKKAEGSLAFSLNGEPVAAAKLAVRKPDFARGLNLIRNGGFQGPALPWRFVGEPSGGFGLELAIDKSAAFAN